LNSFEILKSPELFCMPGLFNILTFSVPDIYSPLLPRLILGILLHAGAPFYG
jgi:hypothetical protein